MAKPTQIRVKARLIGGHYHCRFFTGVPGFTFAGVGQLVMTEDDLALFADVPSVVVTTELDQ